MKTYHKIPTNIVTGFLGVGKTTALNHLLAQKPEGETWAVLVNEFGQIGVDQTALPSEDGLHVRELAGGCICCALGPTLAITLTMLIKRSNPDRLIIEPTGLGHPEGIIDVLQGISFEEVLDLRATVCLLDPRALEQPEVVANEVFQDQINLADVIAINKCDLANDAQVAQAEQLLGGLFPPKQQVLRCEQGQIPLAALDRVRNGELQSQFPEAHHHDHDHDHDHQHNHAHEEHHPLPGQPVRKIGEGSGMVSCGWVFHRDDSFDYERLSTYLVQLDGIQRIKGAIRIGYAWIFFNRVMDEHSVSKLAYRRDTRLEIIAPNQLDWEAIESAILACRVVEAESGECDN